jgi:hypothetical protein
VIGAAGKNAAILAGLGAVGVAVLAGVFWEDIAVQYHLWRLQQYPAYLMEVVRCPEGTVERRSVRAYLQTHAGAEALFSAYIRRFEEQYEPVEECNFQRLETVRSAVICIINSADGRPCGFVYDLRWPEHLQCSGWRARSDTDEAWVRGFAELLEHLEGRSTRLPGYPSLSFVVMPVEKAWALHRPFQGQDVYQSQRPRSKYACLVQRVTTL